MYNARPVAPGGSSPHFAEALSGCLLRLLPRRRPTLVGCSFPRPEPPATCLLSPPVSKATFTSGPEQNAAVLCEGMQATVGSARLKLSACLVCAGGEQWWRGEGGLAPLSINLFFIKDPFRCCLSKIKAHLHFLNIHMEHRSAISAGPSVSLHRDTNNWDKIPIDATCKHVNWKILI